MYLFTLHTKLIILQKRGSDSLIRRSQRAPFSEISFFFSKSKMILKRRTGGIISSGCFNSATIYLFKVNNMCEICSKLTVKTSGPVVLMTLFLNLNGFHISSANPTKWSNTFDPFVGLAVKRLRAI